MVNHGEEKARFFRSAPRRRRPSPRLASRSCPFPSSTTSSPDLFLAPPRFWQRRATSRLAVRGKLSSPGLVRRCNGSRARAAEVHNLSEKRRRCKINEKMKALQSLVPNSSKTDKASMLDDAIEYLKHLQLQGKMLLH